MSPYRFEEEWDCPVLARFSAATDGAFFPAGLSLGTATVGTVNVATVTTSSDGKGAGDDPAKL